MGDLAKVGNGGALSRRGVAVMGNSEDIRTWSGTPYHLLRAGRNGGFLASGLNLSMTNLAVSRSIWQIHCLLRCERPRGFQYSPLFIEWLGKKAVAESERLDLGEVVTHYQLLPAQYLLDHSVTTSFYIDTTLQDLFETHGMYAWLNSRIAREAIEREQAEYHTATRVVTMAAWVSSSVKDSYGVPEERVHTVLPGANLPEEEVQRRLKEKGQTLVPERFTGDRPFRLGFTGKDWQRKGLPRLVAATEILNRAGFPAKVVVIGNLPETYRSHPAVIHAGFIDKSRDLSRFMDTIEGCDLGCAPSYEEPMGIAPLEYLRLGVPVLCTAAGGLNDVCSAAGPASILLDRNATAEEIAAELETLARNPERLQRMRTAAWTRKEHFSWERTINTLQSVWNQVPVSDRRNALCEYAT